MKPVFYLHCKQCIEEALPPNLDAFVDKPGRVWLWCRNHNIEVFHTQIPVLDPSQMKCAHCESGVAHDH
jgi:hypothetical protein